MKNKRVKLIILLISILLMIFIVINAITGNRIIGNIYQTMLASEDAGTDKILTWVAYDNQELFDEDITTNNIKVLININHANGIEYIETPEGNIINGNGKKNVSLDYTIAENDTKTFEIKPVGESIVNEDIIVTQEIISTYLEEVRSVENGETKYSFSFEDLKSTDKLYYKSGDITTNKWNEGIEDIRLDLADIEIYDESDTRYKTGTATINIKKEDQANNIIYIEKECNIEASKYDIFRSLKNKCKGIDDYYVFSSYLPNNQVQSYVPYDLGYGHSSGIWSCSGYYILHCDDIFKAIPNKVSVEFEVNASGGGRWVTTSLQTFYKDSTNGVIKDSTHTDYANYVLEDDIDNSKTIDYIKMVISRI